ncbi:hypothetical protein AMTRI_Chr07g78240 [Amborella trichopoda]
MSIEGENQDMETVEMPFIEMPPPSSPKRKTTSSVWEDFEKVTDEKGELKALCKHCKRKLAEISKNGTSHLKKRLILCPQRVRVNLGQQMLVTCFEKRMGV